MHWRRGDYVEEFFTDLAVSMSERLTQYVNQIFVVTREVRDPISHAIQLPADYSHVGQLFIAVTAIGLILPMIAIAFAHFSRYKSE